MSHHVDAPGAGGRTIGAAKPPTWFLVAIVLLPLAVSTVAVVCHVGEYRPVGDLAATELRLRDLGRHAVLIGPYSRDGWSHLGPSLYYALVVPYRLLGSSSLALPIGALIINAAAIATMAVVSRRRGGTAVMIMTLVGCALLVRSLGAEFVQSAWNPSVTVLPFGALVLLCWAMTCGSTTALPAAAAVTTYLVHTHVGYVPLAIPLLLWGTGWLVALARQTGPAGQPAAATGVSNVDIHALIRSSAVAVGVLAALWAAPLIDQLSGDPGNLTRVVRYFTGDRENTHTLADGARVLAGQFSVDLPWLTGIRDETSLGEPRVMGELRLPIFAPLFATAGAFLVARGPPSAARFVYTLSFAMCMSVLAVARTPELVFAYRLYGTWVLAMLAAVVIAWAVSIWLRRRSMPVRWVRPVAIVGLAALAIVNAYGAARADIPEVDRSSQVAELTDDVLRTHPPEVGEVIVLHPVDFIAGSVAAGMLVQLERAGVDASIRTPFDLGNLRRVIQSPNPAPAEFTVTTSVRDVKRLLGNRHYRLVGYSGEVPVDELGAYEDRSAAHEAAWKEGKLSDEEFVERLVASAARLPSVAALFQRLGR